MQDLTWIKTIFENYKRRYDVERASEGLCTMHEHKYKTEAANELLEDIKEFIKEANVLVEQQKNGPKKRS